MCCLFVFLQADNKMFLERYELYIYWMFLEKMCNAQIIRLLISLC